MSMHARKQHFESQLNGCPLLPTIEPYEADWETLLPVCEAAGLTCIEVLLRHAGSLALLTRLKGLTTLAIGAGTVTNVEQCEEAIQAGADFIVSPGLSKPLVRTAQGESVPILPGVATPTEIMAALDLGLMTCKFFPARAMGGTERLKAFAGPFPQMRFIPTGGIAETDFRNYLALPNVAAAGGGFILPPAMLKSGNANALQAHLGRLLGRRGTA
jgi:2-dehydro-3-deoxyphosphogluconate aldolase/(4S)-4-hydroxy-2-oxoglutarate aldolase